MGDLVPHGPTEALIAAAPHAVFARIAEAGYSLLHTVGGYRRLEVLAFHGGRQVAEAVYSAGGNNAYGHCQYVTVEEGHRKKGIGTAMHMLAERFYGKQLENFWHGDSLQTPAGIALWAQTNRPFGPVAGGSKGGTGC